jgi:hypothetical protein
MISSKSIEVLAKSVLGQAWRQRSGLAWAALANAKQRASRAQVAAARLGRDVGVVLMAKVFRERPEKANHKRVRPRFVRDPDAQDWPFSSRPLG